MIIKEGDGMEKKSKVKYRIAASVVDWVIIILFCFLISILPLIDSFNALFDDSIIESLIVIISTILLSGICFIFIIIYMAVIPSIYKGQTLGKMIFKIKVVKIDGSDVDFLTMFNREICGKLLIDFASVGLSIIARFFSMVINPKHQAFHDVLSSTMVIDVE